MKIILTMQELFLFNQIKLLFFPHFLGFLSFGYSIWKKAIRKGNKIKQTICWILIIAIKFIQESKYIKSNWNQISRLSQLYQAPKPSRFRVLAINRQSWSMSKGGIALVHDSLNAIGCKTARGPVTTSWLN